MRSTLVVCTSSLVLLLAVYLAVFLSTAVVSRFARHTSARFHLRYAGAVFDAFRLVYTAPFLYLVHYLLTPPSGHHFHTFHIFHFRFHVRPLLCTAVVVGVGDAGRVTFRFPLQILDVCRAPALLQWRFL